MIIKRAQGDRGRGAIPCVVLALLLISAAGAAESTKDFSAATGDGSIITKDGQGGYDLSKVDTVEAGREASSSGTPGAGGGTGGAADRRDDTGSCNCSVDQSPGPGLAALVLLLLLAARRKRTSS